MLSSMFELMCLLGVLYCGLKIVCDYHRGKEERKAAEEIQPTTEVQSILKYYDAFETAHHAYNNMEPAKTQVKLSLYFRTPLIWLQRCSLLSDTDLECLLEDKSSPAKSKAFYNYLRPQAKVVFSKNELEQIPALLNTMCQLQKAFYGHLQSKKWDALKGFLAGQRTYNQMLLNWNRADLSGANLEGICLNYTLLTQVNFSRANLSNAQLDCAFIQDVNLEGTGLAGINWNAAHILPRNFTIRHSCLDQAAYEVFVKAGVCDFTHVYFIGNFKGVVFKDLLLDRATFTDGLVTSCTFSNSRISCIHFTHGLEKSKFQSLIYSKHVFMEKIERMAASLWASNDEVKKQSAIKLTEEYRKILVLFQQNSLNPVELNNKEWLFYIKIYGLLKLADVIEPRLASQVIHALGTFFNFEKKTEGQENPAAHSLTFI